MSFYEIQFPDNISYGSSGGPGFSTTIVGLDTGAEQRVSRWSKARRKYDVSYGVKTYQDLQDVIKFYMAVKGAAYGFRYKDWLDFTTAIDGRSDYTDDSALVPLFSNNTELDMEDNMYIQLQKRYQLTQIDGSGDTTVVIRNITKPVRKQSFSRVRIAISDDGGITFTNIPSGNYSVNETTGIVTYMDTLEPGWTVFGSCEFDVPVRFTKSMDDLLSVSLDTFDTGNSDSIELIEIVDHNEHFDEYFYGGSSTISVESDITLSVGQGRVIALDPDASGHKIILPDPYYLAPGGPYFYLINQHNSRTMLLRDARGEESNHDGLSNGLSETLSGSKTGTMWINEFGDSTRQWYFWQSQ